jgi:hypothetical protein
MRAHWILRALERITWDASVVACAVIVGLAIIFVGILGSL